MGTAHDTQDGDMYGLQVAQVRALGICQQLQSSTNLAKRSQMSRGEESI